MLLLVSLALFAAAVWQGLRCVRGRQDGSGRDALLGVLLFYLSITAMRWAAGPGYMEATSLTALSMPCRPSAWTRTTPPIWWSPRSCAGS